jgi:tRNA1Val (adenine37-N6)-methyltransferase
MKSLYVQDFINKRQQLPRRMFRFKQFSIEQDLCAMKVGTDGVLLGAWASIPPSMAPHPTVLDVGTGTGLVALMMAQRYTNACVTGIDIDNGAVCQAAKNVSSSPFADRISIVRKAVQEYEGAFDAVVSNPPFFDKSLKTPNALRNMARHTDTLTYAELMHAAHRLLKDDGELSVVVPFDYRKRMEDEATFMGFFPSRVLAVRTTPNQSARRFLLAFKKHSCERSFEVMTVGDENYCRMMADFYLNY